MNFPSAIHTLYIHDFDGKVIKVTGEEIWIKDNASKLHKYQLMKYVRSNQDTCINQKPIVTEGSDVKAGDVIADGASTAGGELSLGKNVIVAYMPWEGYNYEDAILLNERLVYNNTERAINAKMNSDKTLLSYKNDIVEATQNINKDDIFVAGALVIRHNDTASIVLSGYDNKYKRFVPNYFLHYNLINYYLDFKFI